MWSITILFTIYTHIMDNITNFVVYIIARLKRIIRYDQSKFNQHVYVGSSGIGDKTFPQ